MTGLARKASGAPFAGLAGGVSLPGTLTVEYLQPVGTKTQIEELLQAKESIPGRRICSDCSANDLEFEMRCDALILTLMVPAAGSGRGSTKSSARVPAGRCPLFLEMLDDA